MENRDRDVRKKSGDSSSMADCDKLSKLPVEILFKILSFLSIKESVRTSALAKKYRTLYASLPDLIFDDSIFRDHTRRENLESFIDVVLGLRDHTINVNKLVLRYNSIDETSEKLLKYAICHGVKHIEINQGDLSLLPECFYEFPPESGSLTTLKLSNQWGYGGRLHRKLDFRHLVCLSLRRFMLTIPDMFSDCHTLRDLKLTHCYSSPERYSLNICAIQISRLTIQTRRAYYDVRKITISIPRLDVFDYSGDSEVDIISKNCDHHLLQTARIVVRDHYYYCELTAKCLICMFKFTRHAKFVTLSSNILKYLSSYQGLLQEKHSPFQDLISLNILQCPEDRFPHGNHMESKGIEIVLTYLLKDSPNAEKIEVPGWQCKTYTRADIGKRCLEVQREGAR